jgi:L-2-hydroxyglutarate oxidase LhgO
MQLLTRDEARAMEPQLECEAALLSPSTGIIDSHGLMTALLGDAERAGAMLAVQSPVLSGAVTPDGIRLEVGSDDGSTVLLARTVVNSAGLTAPDLARRIDGIPPEHIPPQYYAKGCYFTLAGRAPFSRLIYPVPEAAGLGVHLTLDMGARHASVPTCAGSTRSNTACRRTMPIVSTTKSAATGPAWPTAHCSRVMPASGRRSVARRRLRPISGSTGLGRMACRGW